MAQEASVNSDARSAMEVIEERVARTQVKYHRWAKTDRDVRFGDLFNLVCHPVYLLVAWEHVAHNKGARGDRRSHRASDLPVRAGRGVPGGDRLRSQGRHVSAFAGAAGIDPQTGREVTPVGDPDGGGILPRRPVTIWVLLSSRIRSIR
jgi:hypothetical protein